jgi:hypothetical protein
MPKTKYSHKYFKNIDCKYFPCHKIKNDGFFNCLFCFCPLFLDKNCGGKYLLINEIKDCSDCTIVHNKAGYKFICSKLKKSTKVL